MTAMPTRTERNGWAAGSFSPYGGWMAAGEAANSAVIEFEQHLRIKPPTAKDRR